MFPFGEPVTILDGAATSQDDDGNDVATWPTKATYPSCGVAPSDGNGTGGNEQTDARDTVVIGLTVFLPDGADVSPTDRAIVRGQMWEVVGEPQAWQNPFTGWRPGVPVALRRVKG